jgi:O-methyltransferase
MAFANWLRQHMRFVFWIAQALLGRIGYAITERGLRRIAPGEYTLQYPYAYVTFSPWFANGFKQEYARIRSHTACTEQRAYMVRQFARHCAHLPGDFAECGVYRGGTARLEAEVLREFAPEKRLHLFDSFEGMPPTRGREVDGYRQGDFGDTSLDEVRAFLGGFDNVDFHPGFIPGTLEAVTDRRFAFVHIDVDIYESTRDALEFFYDRLSPGGVMICDDYGFVPLREAARKAVDDVLRERPEEPLHLPTAQCLMIKLG